MDAQKLIEEVLKPAVRVRTEQARGSGVIVYSRQGKTFLTPEECEKRREEKREKELALLIAQETR